MMAKKNLFTFKIFDADSGEVLKVVSFYGADSEEAFVNCNEWIQNQPTWGRNYHVEEI